MNRTRRQVQAKVLCPDCTAEVTVNVILEAITQPHGIPAKSDQYVVNWANLQEPDKTRTVSEWYADYLEYLQGSGKDVSRVRFSTTLEHLGWIKTRNSDARYLTKPANEGMVE